MMFQIVPNQEFPALKTVLEARLPKSAMLYNVLNNLQSGRLPPCVSTTIYSFKDPIEGTESLQDNEVVFILAIQSREDASSVILSTHIIPSPSKIRALEELVDWKHPICFCAVDVLYSNLIADVCKKYGIGKLGPCDFMTMSIPDTKKLQFRASDPSIQIKELSPSDAELVTKRWKFASPNSQGLMEETIRCIGSAGVYLKDKPVSWVVIFAIGSINALYTEDDFRGKGYGKLTMQKVCQVAGDRGLVPNVQIELGNTPSKNLMEAAGFTYSHNIEWIFYTPN